jgi:ABC-2 type transport system permease protein
MFGKIFLFEVQNRLRRPAIYIYFAAALIFTASSFATGSMPLGEKEHINAPYMLAFWCAAMSMIMMLVSSSVMGTALYRDIEFNTKDYYLTYPITKAGYFWGRYAGSFLLMLLLGASIILGEFIGTQLGPAMGWRDAPQYGPNHLAYYLQPFLTIVLPNLFFTASLFYGLVAITRNVKVIYTGGILLFLGYFIAFFFLDHTNNTTVMTLADPFVVTGVRLQIAQSSFVQQNSTLVPIEGNILLNRAIWVGLGLGILLFTYIRFNFETFFSGKRDKAAIDDAVTKVKRPFRRAAKTGFTGAYNRSTLLNLVRVELTNIIRDSYFWIIMGAGALTLGLAFCMGDNFYEVDNFPRTVMVLNTFSDTFVFFIFFLLLFYTGETLHRDRVTRYAFINDSLPPPNWVVNGSKLISLLILGLALSLLPLLAGVTVQLAKGFHLLNLPLYAQYELVRIIPNLIEMVLFAYAVHVLINNKFAAHAVGVVLWLGFYFLESSGVFNYHLLMYGYTPETRISDMDGLGHMAGPIGWFHLYWLAFGGLLIILSALFFYRGVSSSIKERLQLLRERFDLRTRLFGGVVLILFLGVGTYNYYNISYLNNFLTKGESEDRAVLYEKTLKHYDSLPMPKVTGVRLFVDLFPDKQQAYTRGFVTLVNKTRRPVTELLLDGDELTNYSLKTEGKDIPFSYPLIYRRGMMNWFRPKNDTAPFRLYRFSKPLVPGDSVVLEVNSSVVSTGFRNGLYGEKILRNGTFFTSTLPELGYDDDDEVSSAYVRRKNHLPKKVEEEIAQDDSVGISTLKASKVADLLSCDITASTSGDQVAIAPGRLEGQWKKDGRNYFHYVQTQPGMYVPIAIVSGKYATLTDSIQLDHKVYIHLFYDPVHNANLQRFVSAYKDGLRYYSTAYGSYPFDDIRFAETSVYGPRQGSMTTFDMNAENFGWNANFTDPNQFDFCYFTTTQQLAQQWWRFQVAPNETVGSLVIPEGLALYDALVMAEKKYGKDNIRWILQQQLWPYYFDRRRLNKKEPPVIRGDDWIEYGGKASVVLYGLRDLLGEDSINAALREFKNEYAFSRRPPYPGTDDLYRYLKKRTPDSLQYYLTDNFMKITFYDNKVTEVSMAPTGKSNEYKVSMTVDVNKVYIDEQGNDVPARDMNDYIDIGLFGGSTVKDGRWVTNPLYLKKYKLTAGRHVITVIVQGKPMSAGIDPYSKLIDRQSNDNYKNF